MGVVACPVMNRYAPRMPPGACPYDAVGMQRASHSAIGLPSSSSIASLMLGFLMPADVRRSFTLPPESVLQTRTFYDLWTRTRYRPPDYSKVIAFGLDPVSRPLAQP